MLPPDVSHSANLFENRRFSYKELKRITNNFDTVVGRGGFGLVYAGRLENGASVAVKMRSETSSQGNTEFLAEVHVQFSKLEVVYCLSCEYCRLMSYPNCRLSTWPGFITGTWYPWLAIAKTRNI
jgi:hypothetical protein